MLITASGLAPDKTSVIRSELFSRILFTNTKLHRIVEVTNILPPSRQTRIFAIVVLRCLCGGCFLATVFRNPVNLLVNVCFNQTQPFSNVRALIGIGIIDQFADLRANVVQDFEVTPLSISLITSSIGTAWRLSTISPKALIVVIGQSYRRRF